MPKLMEFKPQGIKCDAKGCGWSDMSVQFDAKTLGREWLGVPCPKCGSNLYTEADYKLMRKLKRTEKVINGLFGWIVWFTPKDKRRWANDDPLTLNSDGRGVITEAHYKDGGFWERAMTKAAEVRAKRERGKFQLVYQLAKGKKLVFLSQVAFQMGSLPLRTRWELFWSAIFRRDGKSVGIYRGRRDVIAALLMALKEQEGVRFEES